MSDMHYIDGFVCAVPNDQREAYVEYSRKFGAIFREYGALSVVDAWGDDVPDGKLTSFPLAVKREANETVAFGWVAWPSRAVRDAAWGRMQSDPRFAPGNNVMPFDGKRMIFGGFQVLAAS